MRNQAYFGSKLILITFHVFASKKTASPRCQKILDSSQGRRYISGQEHQRSQLTPFGPICFERIICNTSQCDLCFAFMENDFLFNVVMFLQTIYYRAVGETQNKNTHSRIYHLIPQFSNHWTSVAMLHKTFVNFNNISEPLKETTIYWLRMQFAPPNHFALPYVLQSTAKMTRVALVQTSAMLCTFCAAMLHLMFALLSDQCCKSVCLIVSRNLVV